MNFLKAVSFIFEGWRNHLIPPEDLKEIIEKVYEERLKICEECESHSKHRGKKSLTPYCMECGCPFVGKLKCLSCTCPKDKWAPVTSLDVQIQIEEEIKQAENNNLTK